MSKTSTKYHYFYKITNNLNGHFYYGVHNTNNLNDGYMGSGTRLHYAYKKYGIENFTKEILKFFDTSKEAFEYESEVVNEDLIKDDNCYNIKQGGDGWQTIGLITVKDKDGNCFDVQKDDPRYLSGELVHSTKYTKCVYNTETCSYLRVSTEIIKDNDNLIPLNTDKVKVFDKNGNCFTVDINDNRIGNELIVWSKNHILAKDNNGNNFLVNINDERLKNGQLKNFWIGHKHSEESKNKLKETHKNTHYQLGEKNSQYGKCWIHNDKESKSILKTELNNYLNNGWIKGRKMKF